MARKRAAPTISTPTPDLAATPVAPAEPTPDPTQSLKEEILACIRARIGDSASADKCAVTLAAAAGVCTQVVRKLLRGEKIRVDVAGRVASTLQAWGLPVVEAELAVGYKIPSARMAS